MSKRNLKWSEAQVNAAALAIYRESGWDRAWPEIYESARERFRTAARAALEAATNAK